MFLIVPLADIRRVEMWDFYGLSSCLADVFNKC